MTKTKTKTKKILAIFAIATLTFNSTYAATQIGTGSVTGQSSFDSAVMWDDTIPGLATGSVNGITVTAKVLPTLNMVISTGAIDLGILNAAAYSTGSLDIEIGTNASNGATVSAKSTQGGLHSASNGSSINDTTTDGIAESYKFSSALNAASDSSVAGYTHTAALDSEVNNTTSSYTLYTTNKPESSSGVNDVTFFVSAKIDEQTPAGMDYNDTVTITVVGNF
ncbi:MAG: hypothetical protein PHN31_03935 [Candidatus Gracilibacteria bacterium]|nr:hypothetical protein [Candidatus Gracilibacteria bacterium]